VRFFIANLLARTGSYLCHKAIALAGRGHLDFELYTRPPQMLLPKASGTSRELTGCRFRWHYLALITIILGVMTVMVWRLNTAVETVAQKLVDELRAEHREEMRNVKP